MDREQGIEEILRFVREHPESYASLAVCRRALDVGLERVTAPHIAELDTYLHQAPDDEIAAYYYIVL